MLRLSPGGLYCKQRKGKTNVPCDLPCQFEDFGPVPSCIRHTWPAIIFTPVCATEVRLEGWWGVGQMLYIEQ